MKKISIQGFAALLLVSGLFSGCGGGADVPAAASVDLSQTDATATIKSCSSPSEGLCADLTGSIYRMGEIAAEVIKSCQDDGGTVLQTACPTANRAGTCTYQAGTDSEVKARMYKPKITATTGKSLCQAAGGTWTAN
jgi:hypothetical protein